MDFSGKVWGGIQPGIQPGNLRSTMSSESRLDVTKGVADFARQLGALRFPTAGIINFKDRGPHDEQDLGWRRSVAIPRNPDFELGQSPGGLFLYNWLYNEVPPIAKTPNLRSTLIQTEIGLTIPSGFLSRPCKTKGILLEICNIFIIYPRISLQSPRRSKNNYKLGICMQYPCTQKLS